MVARSPKTSEKTTLQMLAKMRRKIERSPYAISRSPVLRRPGPLRPFFLSTSQAVFPDAAAGYPRSGPNFSCRAASTWSFSAYSASLSFLENIHESPSLFIGIEGPLRARTPAWSGLSLEETPLPFAGEGRGEEVLKYFHLFPLSLPSRRGNEKTV